ncbi:hypothetical protein CAEBREN_13444 [Caenorhabditis brenneri]|uniref:Uncharacterized protein n=1 Tax=Caenorhabditis brenneri TaxID=135651 RepID=G0P3M0_CAEBE|nr:hypothetical protein CAEBREN_13444 [Caenorhabditis brenneri]
MFWQRISEVLFNYSSSQQKSRQFMHDNFNGFKEELFIQLVNGMSSRGSRCQHHEQLHGLNKRKMSFQKSGFASSSSRISVTPSGARIASTIGVNLEATVKAKVVQGNSQVDLQEDTSLKEAKDNWSQAQYSTFDKFFQ